MKTIFDYAKTIALLDDHTLSGNQLPEELLIQKESPLSIYYAPFDHVNPGARIVILGITPGRTQALLALRKARDMLQKGASPEEAGRVALQFASFGGAMRLNLVRMLECIGLQKRLGISDCAQLFDPECRIVQFGSALTYPVFVNGNDYNGNPSMLRTPVLQQHLLEYTGEMIRVMGPETLFLPLGPKPTEAIEFLGNKGGVDRAKILNGLPHPSGANAERIAIFLGTKSPELASKKTNSGTLLSARERLIAQLA